MDTCWICSGYFDRISLWIMCLFLCLCKFSFWVVHAHMVLTWLKSLIKIFTLILNTSVKLVKFRTYLWRVRLCEIINKDEFLLCWSKLQKSSWIDKRPFVMNRKSILLKNPNEPLCYVMQSGIMEATYGHIFKTSSQHWKANRKLFLWRVPMITIPEIDDLFFQYTSSSDRRGPSRHGIDHRFPYPAKSQITNAKQYVIRFFS